MDMEFDMMQTRRNALSQKRNPNPVDPIEKPDLDIREKDEVRTKRPSMWNVVFYNDDYTPIEFVEFVLKGVFHISTLDALALTLVVHTKGKGIAGTYTFEIAEQMASGRPLRLSEAGIGVRLPVRRQRHLRLG
jgi:ATP-dependent Clp protease adaptor protein ClpS